MTTTVSVPQQIVGLRPVAENYAALILDLWGVVHDGIRALPGAVEVLEQMRAIGKPVCLVSNAPRRVAVVEQQLADLGIFRSLYAHLITSGEMTFEHMRAASGGEGTKAYFHLGPSLLAGLGEGCGFSEALKLEDADIILCTGTDRIAAIDAVLPTLRVARGLELPMLCANPDREVMIGDQRVLCAGAIADAYEAMGGRVTSFGKPYPEVYGRARSMLGVEVDEVLAIGDSVVTDISGANAAGIDAVLVTSGIHHALFNDPQAFGDAAAWGELVAQHGARPRFVINFLRW